MEFISIIFFAFFCCFFIVYYSTPLKWRYIIVFLGSFIFYGWVNPAFLIVLSGVTLWTWFGGMLLEKSNDKKIYVLFFLGSVFILGLYKYAAFFVENLNAVGSALGRNLLPVPDFLVPVGLSFYTFQTCTYLGDIYHGKLKAEHNLVLYASFSAFFPTILSGPIQKARDLLPQLRNPAQFDAESTVRGLLRVFWGIFVKICVADRLSYAIENLTIEEGDPWRTSWYLFSAIAFSVYIYADFASYSDIAIGIARILGIRLRENFINPYLSLTLTEFWERWHASLNEWLVEYVYIPLGGSRHGSTRKYINIMLVFLISGLWHGAQWHFVIWGLLNGFLMIVGQITSPLRKRVYQKLKIDETSVAVRMWKRGNVFLMITGTWLLFSHGIGTSIHMLTVMFSSPLVAWFNPGIWSVCGTVSQTVLMFVMTVIFAFLQCQRNGRSKFVSIFRKQPLAAQYLIIGVMLVLCVFIGTWNSASVNTAFLYFQF